jgi:hypothetical protein
MMLCGGVLRLSVAVAVATGGQIASLTVRDAIVMKWSTDLDTSDLLGVARRNSTSIWSCRNSELSNLRSFEVGVSRTVGFPLAFLAEHACP